MRKCVSMSNQECKVRPAIININSNEPLFYPYSNLVNKYSGSCNDIVTYTLNYVPRIVKNMNIKVFNLMSRTNETHHISWHETFPFKGRLDASVCSDKQLWNNDKGRCECKEVTDKGTCDDRSIWNPSTCKFDKSCNVVEYLKYANFKSKERLTDKLVKKCYEDIDGNKIIYNATLNDYIIRNTINHNVHDNYGY